MQCDLVLSKQNPWPAYSPDDVIFKDGKPWKLLEIKCPFDGKIKPIEKSTDFVIYSAFDNHFFTFNLSFDEVLFIYLFK